MGKGAPNDHHKRRFLNLPKYPGGATAYKTFITENLRYPDEALAHGVEGSVVVEFDITDEGNVVHPRIVKGVGFGCDEEALRLVRLLNYEKVRNRGVRLKMTTKTTIHFKLPGVQITYTTTPPRNEPPKENPGSYEYTIQF